MNRSRPDGGTASWTEEAVRSIGLPTLGHVLEAATDPRLIRYAGQGLVVGRVVTVRLTSTDSTLVHYATTIVRRGDFVVIQAVDLAHAPFGGIIAASFARSGVVGVAIDGTCTDLDGLTASGLSVYARGTSAMTTRKGPGDVEGDLNAEIDLGDIRVSPHMVALGDEHGVLFVTDEDIEAALEMASTLARAEPRFMHEIQQGRTFGDVYLDPELVRTLNERTQTND